MYTYIIDDEIAVKPLTASHTYPLIVVQVCRLPSVLGGYSVHLQMDAGRDRFANRLPHDETLRGTLQVHCSGTRRSYSGVRVSERGLLHRTHSSHLGRADRMVRRSALHLLRSGGKGGRLLHLLPHQEYVDSREAFDA